MKKLKIFGINKDEGHAEIILEKSQDFIPMIRKVVKQLTGEDDYELFIEESATSGCADEKIEKWTDRCKHRKYKEYELDLFVGKNRIIIAVRSSAKNQKIFIDKMMKFCKWGKMASKK